MLHAYLFSQNHRLHHLPLSAKHCYGLARSSSYLRRFAHRNRWLERLGVQSLSPSTTAAYDILVVHSFAIHSFERSLVGAVQAHASWRLHSFVTVLFQLSHAFPIILVYSPAVPPLFDEPPSASLSLRLYENDAGLCDSPLLVASSKSAVSTAAAGRWTYRTTLPLMNTFLTEDWYSTGCQHVLVT